MPDGKGVVADLSHETGEPAVLSHESFFLTPAAYAETVDQNQACKDEFGDHFRIADWVDIEIYYARVQSMDSFFSDLGMPSPVVPGTETGDAYSVAYNGSEHYTATRHYYISRHDHNKPSHFLAHDDINNFELSLGSWSGNRRALCHDDS